jgi:transposase
MTDAQTLLQRIAELEAQNALLEQQAKQQAAINLLLEQV